MAFSTLKHYFVTKPRSRFQHQSSWQAYVPAVPGCTAMHVAMLECSFPPTPCLTLLSSSFQDSYLRNWRQGKRSHEMK